MQSGIIVNSKKLNYYKSLNELVINISNGVYVSLSAESIMLENNDFTNIVNANFGYADGEVAAWALRKGGFKDSPKIAGVELWLEVLRKKPNARLAIVGGSQSVIDIVLNRLQCEFPDLNIIFSSNGYDVDLDVTTKEIVKLEPDILITAMGQPYQEIFADKVINSHPCICICVGGALDVYSGKVDRAPLFFIKYKLEWLYRLYKEPKRIGRQLSIPNVVFKILFKKNFIKVQ